MRVYGTAVRETVSFVAESSSDPFTRVLNEVINNPRVGPYELAVFCRLAIHADWQKQEWDDVWPSMDTVAKRIGKPISRDAAFKALKVLQDIGVIKTVRKQFGKPSTYHVRLPRTSQSSAQRTIDSPPGGYNRPPSGRLPVRVADTNESLNQRTRKSAFALGNEEKNRADRARAEFKEAEGREAYSRAEVLEWLAKRAGRGQGMRSDTKEGPLVPTPPCAAAEGES